MEPLPSNLKPLFLLHPPLLPPTSDPFQTPYGDPLRRPLTLLRTVMDINRPYRPPQDPLYPLYTTLHYTVWQILASRLIKAKRSGAKESTLRLYPTLTTILSLKSLSMDITSL